MSGYGKIWILRHPSRCGLYVHRGGCRCHVSTLFQVRNNIWSAKLTRVYLQSVQDLILHCEGLSLSSCRAKEHLTVMCECCRVTCKESLSEARDGKTPHYRRTHHRVAAAALFQSPLSERIRLRSTTMTVKAMHERKGYHILPARVYAWT